MADIERRTLGRTGLEVTTLGFGAMELRGPPNAPHMRDDEAGTLLNCVLDEGINFIDTSPDYGRSEELIGKFIARRRSEYWLASKCGCVPGTGRHVHTAENIRRGVEESLRRLQTDHLDLLQFHRSLKREEFDAEGALSEALALKREGKVRFVGVSAILPTLDEQIDMGVFDAFQIPYSALQRDHEEAIGRASKSGAGIIIRGGVARGIPDDWEGRRYYMISNDTMRRYWEEAALDELLEGVSRPAFLLRFTLSHPNLGTVIVGTSSLVHLRDNVNAAVKGPLSDDVVAEAKRRLESAAAGV
jgi:aryl-alcohol dehydrogenase-like predicted oxidoreductase